MQEAKLLHYTGRKEKAKAIQRPKLLGKATARLWGCKRQGPDRGPGTSSTRWKQNRQDVYR